MLCFWLRKVFMTTRPISGASTTKTHKLKRFCVTAPPFRRMTSNGYMFGGITLLTVITLTLVSPMSQFTRQWDMLLLPLAVSVLGLTGAILTSNDKGTDHAYLNNMSVYLVFCITFAGVILAGGYGLGWGTQPVLSAKNPGTFLKKRHPYNNSFYFWRAAWVISVVFFNYILYKTNLDRDYTVTTESVQSNLTADCNISALRYQTQVDATPVWVWGLILMNCGGILFMVLSMVSHRFWFLRTLWYLLGLLTFGASSCVMIVMSQVLYTCAWRTVDTTHTFAHILFIACCTAASLLVVTFIIMPLIVTFMGMVIGTKKGSDERKIQSVEGFFTKYFLNALSREEGDANFYAPISNGIAKVSTLVGKNM